MKISELQAKKISELRELARELGLTGYSTLRKQDLIYRILEAQAEAEAGRPNGAARRAATTQESTDVAPKEEVAEAVSEDAGDETV
ncbi:Rho termination factor N-terminal domain-containing protein, partial [Rhodothermus marinus]